MRALPWAAAFAATLVALSALADGTSEGVRLDYQADARCAGQDAFVAEVHARSPRVRFAADATRALVVRIESHGGKLAGRIELAGTQRDVSGATCEEVISALGLVTALALDPLATMGPVDAGAATATTTPTTTTTPTMPTTSASTSMSTNTIPSTSASTSTSTREDDVEGRKWSFGAGVQGEVVIGAAPNPMFAVPVFFEATRALGKRFGVGGAFRFVHAGDTALTAGGTGADFDWTTGALDLCAVFRFGRVRLNACERNTFGVLEGHGLGIVPAKSATRPWGDLGIALALRVRIAGPFFAEAAGHVGAALVQDRFFLEPNTVVFQTPFFVGEVGGGVGFEIW